MPATSKSENMKSQIFKLDRSAFLQKNNIHYIIQAAKMKRKKQQKTIIEEKDSLEKSKEEEKKEEEKVDISYTFKP